MPARPISIGYLLVALVALHAATAGADSQVKAVAWSEVRESIAATICLVDEPKSPSGYVARFGSRERCGRDKASSALDKAVETAFAE